jgi:hypothetical protein
VVNEIRDGILDEVFKPGDHLAVANTDQLEHVRKYIGESFRAG